MRNTLQSLADHIGAHRDEQREEHERDRARQRLIIATLMGAATLWTAVDAGRQGAWPGTTVVVTALLAAYALATLVYTHAVLRRGAPGLAWQYGFMVMDSVVTVLALVGAPEILASFYSLLMVQIVRCGMRYGERSLWLAWGAAVLAAGAVLPFSAFWRGDSGLLHSFAVMMVIIPVLFGPLVRTLHRSAGALRDAAGADALTGLGNRRTLTTQLHAARERSVRDQTMLAVMLFDLDNFKRVNDTLGHGAGDRLLAAVADVLRAGSRPGDAIARLGGDEFVVLLHGLPVTTGVALARDRATQLVLQIGVAAQELAPGLAVSASAGVHCWTGSPEAAVAEAGPLDESDLLIQADRAMYECKRAGKGRVAITTLQAVGTPVTARPPTQPEEVQAGTAAAAATLPGH